MAKQTTFDLHYHTNVFRLPRAQREHKLGQHTRCLEQTGVNYVASTEHAYKQPFDAYLYLCEATKDLKTHIIPAVEAISSEGVDIIYLYRSEGDLKNALKTIQPFAWNVADMNKLRDDTGAISIIPHPFTPGRTGLANVMGPECFMDLQKEADYVEIHNGLSLHFLENGFKRSKIFNSRKLENSIRYTFRLPKEFRLDDTGWAVSSDAHYPAHQRIVGSTTDMLDGDDWFDFLQQKHHFKRKSVRRAAQTQFLKLWHLMQSGTCTLGEVVEKNLLKTKFKARQTSASSKDDDPKKAA